ncbi:hypothetical protein OIU79_015225 [Salix purpurea]|uniref:Uncharacterized protein n=1 Tax=Salix purpurea TaxID=77065 RepID=A0A9Q0PBH4_SALPP|nr:hypothetical protein OIU79_015225 [Salix purpurea]
MASTIAMEELERNSTTIFSDEYLFSLTIAFMYILSFCFQQTLNSYQTSM